MLYTAQSPFDSYCTTSLSGVTLKGTIKLTTTTVLPLLQYYYLTRKLPSFPRASRAACAISFKHGRWQRGKNGQGQLEDSPANNRFYDRSVLAVTQRTADRRAHGHCRRTGNQAKWKLAFLRSVSLLVLVGAPAALSVFFIHPGKLLDNAAPLGVSRRTRRFSLPR